MSMHLMMMSRKRRGFLQVLLLKPLTWLMQTPETLIWAQHKTSTPMQALNAHRDGLACVVYASLPWLQRHQIGLHDPGHAE
mmetsp:Transcript_68126/g.158100  ORF Transcript_68126/g.158100 Transcript_68126/m.158100 type:complete len:81 (-) Transcript_68126:461-703(-)